MQGKRNNIKIAAAALAALVTTSVAVAATSPSKTATGPGPVVGRAAYSDIRGPWLVWDKKACHFKPTASHPKTYSALLRRYAKPTPVAYTTFDTVQPIARLINGSFTRYAKLANIKLTTLSNQFPSVTQPVPVANQVVVMKAPIVLSSNILPALQPKIQQIYEKACIPMINMYRIGGLPHRTPALQVGFKPAGVALAQGVIGLVKQHGWPSSDTWVVLCGAPQVANGPNTDLDTVLAFRDTVASGLGIPSSQISDVLDCKGTAEGARTTTTDWLTAHPQAKDVIAMMWSDFIAVGMAQALADKGYTPNNSIAAGGEANDATLALMAKGGSIFQVDYDKSFLYWGLFGLSMAEDIVAGRPVPVVTDPKVTLVVGADGAKKLIAARAAALGK